MWAELPTAGDRTRTLRRDRCSDTSTNSVTLARTKFGKIPSRSNVRFRVARFAGGMAMFGCPCRRKRDPFCNAARASFYSRNRIEFQELTAASYCGVWNKNIGSGCAVLPYRMILPVPGSGRLVLFEAYPTRDGIHREIWGRQVFLFDAGNRPVWEIAPEQARRTTCTGISMRPAPRPTPSPPSAISTNDFTRAGSAVTPL